MSVLNNLPSGDKERFAKSAFGGMDVFDLISDLAKLGQDKSGIEEILGLLDVDINDKKIVSALGNIGTQTLSLTNIFGNFGKTAGDVFTGLGAVLMKNLPVIAIIAAIAAAVKLADAAIVTGKEATEAMIESFDEFENAQSEVEALNSELEQTKDSIADLQAKGNLSLVDKEELRNLRESEKSLEMQKDIAEKLAAAKAEQAAQDAAVAYEKNFRYEISQAATDEYRKVVGANVYSSENLAKDANNISANIAAIEGYKKIQSELPTNATESWNTYQESIDNATASIWEQADALMQQKTNLEESKKAIEDNGGYLTEYQQNALDNITSSLDYIYKEMAPETWKQMKIDDVFNQGQFENTKQELKDLAKQYNNLDDFVAAATKKQGAFAKALYTATDGMVTLRDVAENIFAEEGIVDTNAVRKQLKDTFANTAGYGGPAEQAKGYFNTWADSLSEEDLLLVFKIMLDTDTADYDLEQWQNTVEERRNQQLLDYGIVISEERSGIESVTSAINESASATGLASETVKTLTDRYSELEGFNPEALFQNTASGIKLNTNYLAELEKLVEASNQEKIAQSLYELSNQYNDLIDKKSEYLAQGKEDEWNTEVEASEKKIASARQLQAEYAGLTNSYNDWLNAQSAAQGGDWHEAASERLKNLDKLYRKGLYGNTELQEGLEFFTGKDIAGIEDWEERMQAIQDSYAQLRDTIPGTTHSLRDMMATGKQGGQAYLETLQQLGYATYDAAKNAWTFSDSFDTGKIAEDLGTTAEFVNMMNSLLQEYGFNINTSQAQTDIEKIQQKLNILRDAINKINAQTINPSADTGEIDKAIDDIKALMATLQKSGTADQISEFAKSISSLDIPTLEGLGFSFENIDTSNIQAVIGEIEAQLPNLQIPATVEPTTPTTTDGSETGDATVTYTAEFAEASPPELDGIVTYTAVFAAASPPRLKGTVEYSATFSGGVGGMQMVNGTANASGTALAGGNWGTASGGKTLLGELGEEIVVNPHTGRWYTVGSNGAEFADIPKDAIVFNHLQSKALLENGHITSRGKALAGGTALAGGGPGLNGGGSGGSSGSSSSSSSSSDYNPDKEYFDWIEMFFERVERIIERVAKVAESAYKKLTTRSTSLFDEISKIGKEIALKEEAYDYYMSYANNIGLDQKYVDRIKTGTMKISSGYSDELKAQIEDYQEFYEKALDAQDAIDDLHEQLAELYEDNFNNIQDDFDNQLSLIEHATNAYENGIDMLEAKGYQVSTKYYEELQKIEQQNIDLLNNEINDLTTALSQAMASGEIEEGSSAWYEMQAAINDVKEQIDEAELSLQEYANTMRELEWEQFGYAQERISQLTKEADFLIDLLGEDLYDDNGKLNKSGDAAVGLHGMNYNVYMSQADMYAEELKKINKELADDPNNTKLIERKEELLELQQDSIIAAEEEKQAIVDMVEEGIDLELDSLQELIDTYTEALDSAKDLYDYQKKIQDHTSEISTLQKQLLAYENDDSEEARAKKQELSTKLDEAKENLEETEYDQYINDQKKLLDDLYQEYETILNQRLDNTDALFEEMIASSNADAASINATLAEVTDDVGYTMTERMQSIWNDSTESLEGVMSIYGDGFNEKLTSINDALSMILGGVYALADVSDEEASRIIKETTTTTDTIEVELVDNSEDFPMVDPYATSSSSSSDKKSSGSSSNSGSSKSSSSSSSTSSNKTTASTSVNPNIATCAHSYQTVTVPATTTSDGYTLRYCQKCGDEHKTIIPKLKKYSTGGLADFTGLAQLDGSPSKPELVLNAQDTANFIELKEVLEDLANQGVSLAQSYGYDVGTVSHVGSISDISSLMSMIRERTQENFVNSIGDIRITIPIEHVENYNDFVNQLRNDSKFEKMIEDITIGKMNGGSSLSKNRHKW